MRLRPAPGGPELSRALSNQYVLGIVEILLQVLDQEIFRDIAYFLNKYNKQSQANFAEAISDLRTRTFPDEEGNFTVPTYIDELVHDLEALYQSSDEFVGFLRGAILEKLSLQLISQRCLLSECFSNQVFRDEHGREVTGQIDVGVLSNNDYFVEGYECKVNAKGSYGIKSAHCDNLKALVEVAHIEGYYVHVGVISFDNDKLVKRILEHYNARSYIKAYGLDSLANLREPPQYVGPEDDLAN